MLEADRARVGNRAWATAAYERSRTNRIVRGPVRVVTPLLEASGVVA
jgi:hypothetical protein